MYAIRSYYGAWDMASSEPSEAMRYPDYTAGVKMLKNKEGNVIIVGDFAESCRENDSQVYGRFRKRPGDRDSTILKQAQHDGKDCYIRITSYNVCYTKLLRNICMVR